jgi:UDP-N-acetylglucosamine 2-epimerase (non-hydrolysing)
LLLTRDRVNQDIPDEVRSVESLINGNKMVLVTGHRRESHGQGFENICQAIRTTADEQVDTSFVYPVHLNPNVQEPVNRILGEHKRIHLIKPLSYEPFVWLMNRATVVLTDSGGVQEEAPSLGKPVLVMRETTERPEGIEAGNAKLVGVSVDKIVGELTRLLTDATAREEMARIENPYGDGTASQQIADILERKI